MNGMTEKACDIKSAGCPRCETDLGTKQLPSLLILSMMDAILVNRNRLKYQKIQEENSTCHRSPTARSICIGNITTSKGTSPRIILSVSNGETSLKCMPRMPKVAAQELDLLSWPPARSPAVVVYKCVDFRQISWNIIWSCFVASMM